MEVREVESRGDALREISTYSFREFREEFIRK